MPLVNSNNESWCQGLDGLAQRTAEYYKAGARFAKWRGVVSIPAGPSTIALRDTAYGLARYAAIAQVCSPTCAGPCARATQKFLLQKGCLAAAVVCMLGPVSVDTPYKRSDTDIEILGSIMLVRTPTSCPEGGAGEGGGQAHAPACADVYCIVLLMR